MTYPVEMIKAIINQNNPQQAIQKIIGNANPMMSNLIQMAQRGDKTGIENFARNLYREKGLDFDKEFNEFMANFK